MISKEKREIIRVLSSYSSLLTAEKNLSERIDAIRVRDSYVSGYPETISNYNGEHMFLLPDLTARRDAIRREIDWIERSLSVMPEEEERLLREIYLFEKRIPDVPGKRGTEKSSFYRLRSKALSHFALGYDGSVL
ncbi:MAG: hypothetical protein MJ070_08545 [Lachnospiraceae bacterium]|nr:hypothetical protein [Lachnospiraceae bacterium]